MKITNKNIFLSVILIISFVILCPLLSACDFFNKTTNVDNTEPNTNTQNQLCQKLDMSFMCYLTANVDDATAIGIKEMSANEDDNINEENEIKFYLVKYTDNFNVNSPEYNESGLTKVSFTKTRQTIEEVYDANGDLIEMNQTLTQDELSAKINKYYVYDNLTLIQFIPEIAQSGNFDYYDSNNELQTMYIDVRPETLVYDENNVASYDRTNYFSDDLHQSFIIDNATGYIYIIQNFIIDEIKNGLVLSNNRIYDIKIENDELKFISIVQNQTLNISDCWKDKYGNIFVKNDHLNEYDGVNGVQYFFSNNANQHFNNNFYILSKDKTTICINSDWDYPSRSLQNPNKICKITENFEEQNISDTEEYDINFSINDWVEPTYISGIYKGFLYTQSLTSGYFSYVNIQTLQVVNKYIDLQSSYIDYNSIVYYKDNNLYSVNIWGDDDFIIPNINYLTEENIHEKSELLISNCYLENDTAWYYIAKNYKDLTFRVSTLNGTIFYKLVKNNNNKITAVNSEIYAAPDQEIIVLTPINKQ